MHPISEMMEMQASVLSCMVQVKIKKEDFYAASQAGTSHFRWLWSLERANFDIFIRNVVFFVHLFLKPELEAKPFQWDEHGLWLWWTCLILFVVLTLPMELFPHPSPDLPLQLLPPVGRLEAANEQRAIFQQLGDRSREATRKMARWFTDFSRWL